MSYCECKNNTGFVDNMPDTEDDCMKLSKDSCNWKPVLNRRTYNNKLLLILVPLAVAIFIFIIVLIVFKCKKKNLIS